MKPYYQDDAVTIYHADCRDVLPVVGADVLVTDPPYGVNYSSGMGGKFKGTTVAGDDSLALRQWVLDWWGTRPALIFGSWKLPHPEGTKQTLTWEKGDHVGMGDLSLPWRPNTEEVYVLGSGFAGHRGSSVLRVNAPSPNFTPDHARLHPTEKPLALMLKLIAKCPPGAILDPFMGSGSTLRAAKDSGRKALGVEVEERYCEIAAHRMCQEVLDLEAA